MFFQLSRFQDFPKDEKLYLTWRRPWPPCPAEPAGIRMEQQPGSFFQGDPGYDGSCRFVSVWRKIGKKTFGSDSSICWFADQRPEKWLRCISSLEKSIRLALGKGHARNRRLPTFLGHNRSQNSHPKRGVWLGNLQTCHGQTIKPVIGWCSRISPNIPRYLTSRYLI